MKLQSPSSKALHAALNKSAKCIGSKNTLAILNNVLLTRKENRFYFTSATTDSQLTIPAPLTICNGTYNRDIVLPIKMLSALLGTLPDCVVTFDIPDNSQSFTVEYCTSKEDNVKTGKAQMNLLYGDEFPKMEQPNAEQSSVISLPISLFNDVVDKADKFAVPNELRPQLACLCIDVSEDRSEVVFVGTNGHTLVKMTHGNDPAKGGSDFFRSGKPGKTLIYRDYFRTLSAFDGGEDITIENDGHTIRFTSGDTELICKHMEGNFPNYNSVIPKNNPFYVVFDKKEMLDILRRVSLCSSNESKLVEVKKNGLFLTVSARDEDFAVSGEDQVCIDDAQCEDNFRIGLNSTALQNCINTIPYDFIRMQLLDSYHAVVITANDPAPKVLTLCMPVILND